MRSRKPLNEPANLAVVAWASRHNLGTRDLANLLGISLSQASLIMNRRCTITDEMIGYLNRAFGPDSIRVILDAHSEGTFIEIRDPR